MSLQKIPKKFMGYGLYFLTVWGLTLTVMAAEKPDELTGYVARKSVDCFNPENHHHEPEYFMVDDATGVRVELTGQDELLRGIHPKQKVRVSVKRRDKPQAAAAENGLAPDTGSEATVEGEEIEVLEIEPLPMPAYGMEDEPVAAEGANDLTMLSTLLVFISTDTHGCMTSETNARNRLFNNATNANLGMQAITKGRYGLQLGNGTGAPDDHTIDLLLNVNSADHSTSTIETLALNKLFTSVASGGMGLTRLDWDRILLFAPAGISDANFTAYAYYPWGSYTTKGMVSMYGNSYGNNRMNGYLHELGHNFGFAHSRKGTSEYGDRTCVMGISNDGTRTETYNVAKLLETNWLDVFSGARISLSMDSTLDLYPLSSDPNVVTGAMAVSISGTIYSVAYHRNQEPYGYLSQSGDRDRLFVYTRESGSFKVSQQVANLGPGDTYTAGTSVIRFERYGAANGYATVSLDLPDGNTKPVATNQSVVANMNTPLPITLSGTDADSNPLTYTVVSNPGNGTLSGTAPNLTYTPPNNFTGATSFEFQVHDGRIGSYGQINITVESVNTAPPVVDAGPDRTVSFSGSAPWTPAALTTSGWYDASDATTLTLSGDSVSQWADKRGNGLNLTQDMPDFQPKTGINTIGGLTAIKFDGSNDRMTTTSNPFAPTIGDAFVIAVKRIDSTTNGTLFSLSGSVDNASRWQAHAPWGTTVYFDTGGAGGGNRVSASYGVAVGENVLLGLYGSTTDNVQQIFKNGALLAGDATGHSVATVGNIIVGSSYGTQYQNTSIGELLIINGTVSVENRQKLEGYLAHKWGLSGNLPAGHPFIAAPPGGSGVTVNLDGTVSDPDGITPATTWTKISGPGAVTFGNAFVVDTTASFTEAGTYVLRLTANDGLYQAFDEVTINITNADPDSDGNGIADAWEIQHFGAVGLIDGSADSDGDGVLDFFEYLYGSDPTDAAEGGFRFAVQPDQTGDAMVFSWQVQEGFLLGTHYDVRLSIDLSIWNPIPAEYFLLQQTSLAGKTQLELQLTHDYGDKLFLKLIKP